MSHRHGYCTSLATIFTSKCSLFILILYTTSSLFSSPSFAQTIVDGGLTAPVVGWSLSPNLLVNGDFSLGTTGWSFPSTCFRLDPTTPAPNGAASLELTNPATCSKNPSLAINALEVGGGAVYTFSGQIKTENFTGAKSTTARSSICSATTARLSSTAPPIGLARPGSM